MTACTGCWGTAEEEVEDFSSSKKGLVPRRIRWIYSTHGDNGEKQRRGPQVSLLNMPLHSCECCWKHLSVLVKIIKLQTLRIVHPHPATSINRPKAKQPQISQHISYPRMQNQVPIPLCPPLFPEAFCKPILSLSQMVTPGWHGGQLSSSQEGTPAPLLPNCSEACLMFCSRKLLQDMQLAATALWSSHSWL